MHNPRSRFAEKRYGVKRGIAIRMVQRQYKMILPIAALVIIIALVAATAARTSSQESHQPGTTPANTAPGGSSNTGVFRISTGSRYRFR